MKWTSLFKLGATLCLSLQLTSCATIINGTTQKIPLDSYPQGANVSVDGNYMGITPTVVEVKRKHDHFVTFDKEGFCPQTIQLTHVVSGAVAGNIIAGGLIGWGVDACSGGQYRLIPEAVFMPLQPAPQGLAPPQPMYAAPAMPIFQPIQVQQPVPVQESIPAQEIIPAPQ